jgi:hypothetical protein
MLRFDDHARDIAFDQLAIRGRRRVLPVTYVDHGVAVRAPALNINYIAGCDASGGRNDSFTTAI